MGPSVGLEFLPGAGTFMDPPGAVADPAELLRQLNENESRAADLERKAVGALATALNANVQRAAALANQLQGGLNARLNDQELKASKLGLKLQKALNRQLGNVYNYAFPFGITYPTLEQAHAAVETNQPFAGFGLAGPGAPQMAPVDSTGGPGPVGVPPPVATAPPAPGGPFPIVPILPPATQPGAIPPVAPPSSPPGAIPPPAPPSSGPPSSPPLPGLVPSPITGDGFLPSPSPPGGAGGQYPGVDYLPGGGPAPGGGAQCPTGYMQGSVSYQNFGVAFDPNAGPLGQAGPHPLQSGPGGGQGCSPPVNPQSFDVGPNGVFGQGGPAPYMRPWTNGTPIQFQPLPTPISINPACFPPGYTGPTIVFLPQGWSLCIRPSDGWVVGAQGACPDGFQPWDGQGPPGGAGGPPGGVPPGCVPIPPGAQCQVPPIPQCGPDQNPNLPELKLDADIICTHIDQVIQNLLNNPTRFEDFFGMKAGQSPDGSTWKQWAYMIFGNQTPILPDLLGRLGKWLQSIQQKIANMIAIGDRELMQVTITRGIVRLIEKYTGAVPHQLLADIDYVSNTVRQSRLPTTAQADRAWLADMIKDDEWECYVKANGDYVTQARYVRDAARKRPTFNQAQRLFVRQLIDQERYDKLARADGVVIDEDKKNLADWDNYFPTIGEIFRFNQEQLFNEEVISRFELDQDFENLYQDHLKDLADGHQMDVEWARKHYMSRWRRPGYAELVEMTRRLRPDRVDADLVFTDDDLNTALKQEGYPDYFIRRLAKLREHKPTRQDVRRQFMLHVIDEEEVLKQWADQGFAPDFAQQQLEVLKLDRNKFEYHQAGYPAGSALVNDYARGLLTKNEFTDLAQRQIYYDGQADDMSAAAELARNMQAKRQALSGIKRRFTAGLIGGPEAAAELAQAGFDPDQIQELTTYWDQVKKSHPKQVSAATLCTWRKDQLIGAGEQMGALIRLGYSGTDAANIVADCTLKIEQAAQKALEKAQAQATKAATAAAKAEAKNQKTKARAARNGSTP